MENVQEKQGTKELSSSFLPVKTQDANIIPVNIATASRILGMSERAVFEYAKLGHMRRMESKATIKFSLSYILTTSATEIKQNKRLGIIL